MTWHAKPSGAYARNSTAGIDNIFEFRTQLSTWPVECVAGILGNVQAESGFNPWRWQGDRYGTSRGYGLFQYTPASDYLALSGATPNLSVTDVTTGATPQDANRQIQAFRTNELGKWVDRCWRKYWNDDGTWDGTPLYPELWTERTRILNTWGHGNAISLAEFADITDIYDACFVFLACFDGPKVPNIGARNTNAGKIYEILTGVTPPSPPDPPIPPPPPTPTPPMNTPTLLTSTRHRLKQRRIFTW